MRLRLHGVMSARGIYSLAAWIPYSHLPVVILFSCPPGGYAARLSDGERNAEEDNAGRRDFQDCLCFSLCPLCAL